METNKRVLYCYLDSLKLVVFKFHFNLLLWYRFFFSLSLSLLLSDGLDVPLLLSRGLASLGSEFMNSVSKRSKAFMELLISSPVLSSTSNASSRNSTNSSVKIRLEHQLQDIVRRRSRWSFYHRKRIFGGNHHTGLCWNETGGQKSACIINLSYILKLG